MRHVSHTSRALIAGAASFAIAASISAIPVAASATETPTPYDSDEITINSQGHVDSPKIFWNPQDKNFILNAKGDILRPLDKTMNYLSRTVTGSVQEYYYTIPGDPRQKFLGDEGGHLFWAPNNVMPRSQQLWIGFGADADIPVEHFRDESFTLDLVGFEGPGRMDLFTSTLDEDFMLENPVDRLLSSHEPGLRSTWIKPGLHTHNHTTFTQPGRYKVSYRASARLKDGQLLASAPQTVYWQVGGQHPSLTSPETVIDRYNASSTTIHETSGFNPRFSVKPVSDTDEPPLLTEMSFFTGDSADKGTAVFYVNGYFLTEVPVTEGRAAWSDLIGPEDANLQVVYIPADDKGSPRWVSEPLSFAQGDLSDSTQKLGTFPVPEDDESLPAFSYADRTVADNSVRVTLNAATSTFTVTATPAASHLPFRVVGGFYTNATDKYPTCQVDFISYPGHRSYTLPTDECTDVHAAKLRLIPDSLSPVGATEISAEITEDSGTQSHDAAFSKAPFIPQNAPLPPGTTPPPATTPPAGNGSQLGNTGQSGDSPQSGETTPLPPATGGGTISDNPQSATDGAQSTPTPPGAHQGTPAVIDTTPVRITDGHLDIGPRVVDGKLVIVLKDDTRQHATKAVLRDPAAVKISVPHQAKIARSARHFGDTAYDFLGAHGTPLYVLSAQQINGRPWPGFSTEEIDYQTLPNGVSLDMMAVDAPQGAKWWGFTSSTFGGLGQMIFDSTTPMRVDFPTRTHMHLNWAFTHPGTYTMKIRAVASMSPGAGLRAAHGQIQPSEFTTVTFVVEDPAAPSAPGSTPDNGTPGTGGTTPLDGTQSHQPNTTPDKQQSQTNPTMDSGQSQQSGHEGTLITGPGSLSTDKQGTGKNSSGKTGGTSGGKSGGSLASTGSTAIALSLAASLAGVAGALTLHMRRARTTRD